MSKDQPLKVEVKNNKLIISIGIDTLAWSAMNSPDQRINPFNEETGDWDHIEVTDNLEFAEDVMRELTHEQEDGTTPLHILLDNAIYEAICQGSLAVSEDSYPK